MRQYLSILLSVCLVLTAPLSWGAPAPWRQPMGPSVDSPRGALLSQVLDVVRDHLSACRAALEVSPQINIKDITAPNLSSEMKEALINFRRLNPKVPLKLFMREIPASSKKKAHQQFVVVLGGKNRPFWRWWKTTKAMREDESLKDLLDQSRRVALQSEKGAETPNGLKQILRTILERLDRLVQGTPQTKSLTARVHNFLFHWRARNNFFRDRTINYALLRNKHVQEMEDSKSEAGSGKEVAPGEPSRPPSDLVVSDSGIEGDFPFMGAPNEGEGNGDDGRPADAGAAGVATTGVVATDDDEDPMITETWQATRIDVRPTEIDFPVLLEETSAQLGYILNKGVIWGGTFLSLAFLVLSAAKEGGVTIPSIAWWELLAIAASGAYAKIWDYFDQNPYNISEFRKGKLAAFARIIRAFLTWYPDGIKNSRNPIFLYRNASMLMVLKQMLNEDPEEPIVAVLHRNQVGSLANVLKNLGVRNSKISEGEKPLEENLQSEEISFREVDLNPTPE